MPARLSLHSDGWQMWHDSSTSSRTLAGHHALSVCQRSVGKRGVYAYLVFGVGQLFELPMGHAESPRFVVIRRAIGDPVGVVRQTEEMPLQLGERHPASHRYAVADHVQVVLAEVDQAPAGEVFDPCVADVPLLRHGPVEDVRARSYLTDGDRNVTTQDVERLAYTIPGNAAADRKHLLHERAHADRSARLITDEELVVGHGSFPT